MLPLRENLEKSKISTAVAALDMLQGDLPSYIINDRSSIISGRFNTKITPKVLYGC